MAFLFVFFILLFAPPHASAAIVFDGVDDEINLGKPSTMQLTTFTIAAWFYRVGASTANMSTGAGGLGTCEPIVARLLAQVDGSNADGNFFLGINRAGTVLAADYEDRNTGLNWPVNGTSTISTGTWYFGATTFDGTNFKVYVNGVLDGSRSVASLPRSDSIQGMGFGRAFQSGTGTKSGGFNGYINEVAIWDTALSAADIEMLYKARNRRLPMQLSPANLKGYWPMNEGSDGESADAATVVDRTGGGASGTADNGANNTGLTWRAEDVLTYP